MTWRSRRAFLVLYSVSNCEEYIEEYVSLIPQSFQRNMIDTILNLGI